MSARFFHGGVPGLKVGALVLPSGETGARSCADYGAYGVTRRDRVYLTTVELAARMFAAGHPSGRGAVYQVDPIGALEPDPDCDAPGLSFQAPRARVVAVLPFSFSARHRIRAKLTRGS